MYFYFHTFPRFKMAVAEVDLDMDDIFGDGRDVEELLDQPVEQDERDDEAVEAGPTATQGRSRSNIFIVFS